MKWSADEEGLVPPGVVTVTSTVPAAPAGEVAVQVVVDEHDTAVAAVAAKAAVVEPTTKPVPLKVTTVPPARGPTLGATVVTVGPLR